MFVIWPSEPRSSARASRRSSSRARATRSAGRAGSSSGASGLAPRSVSVGSGGAERQLALPLDPTTHVPELPGETTWERMLADYRTTSLSVGTHPLDLLRQHLPPEVVRSSDLPQLEHGSRVAIAGLVVARQRPATANGVVFMLIEDEHGQVNLIVPPPVYDRFRAVVRGEPLLLARGPLRALRAKPERARGRPRDPRAARPPRGERRRGERRSAGSAPLRAALIRHTFARVPSPSARHARASPEYAVA